MKSQNVFDERLAPYFIFIFILLASPKKKHKQTDKQKERWQGHRNSCGQLRRARILIKKNYYKSALAVSYGL